MATYRVQIINQPHRIIALKVEHTILIPLPINYIAELVVELG